MPRHTYQLTAWVEAGDISDLYRGVQDRSREVTFKVFSPRASDPDYGRALVNAARSAGNLQHPSILHFEEVGMRASRLCAVRAHVDGYHLGLGLVRLATREVILPGPVALQIMLEVMAALAAAHAAGVVHGALTPANILVARDGRVFVTEFGALWAMQQSLAMKPLAARGRKGYRAPELEKGGEPDASSDVFSVGAILYELLTLRAVSDGRTGVATRRGALVPPSRLDRRIHARLDPLVLRALDPLRNRRFRSCLEMEEQFRSYLSAQGATAGRVEMGRFVSELFPNEVSVEGPGGELPFVGEFEVEPLNTGSSIPGLAIEVGERLSYSEAAPTETSPDLPEARVADATMLDDPPSEPTAALPQVRAPNDSQNWDAPPGPSPAPSPRAAPPEPEKTEPKGPPTAETVAEHRPPADADRPRFRRPAAELDGPAELPSPRSTAAKNWRGHRPRSPSLVERPGVSLGMWLLAGAMAAGAAGLTYLGFERRHCARASAAHRPNEHLGEELLRQSAPASVVDSAHPLEPSHLRPRSPEAAGAPKREPPAPAAASNGCLSLRADVRAQVSIDDGPPVALPLEAFPIAAGAHKLVVVDARGRYAAKRVDVTDDDTQCPGRSMKVALRHHEAKD